jgi:pseudaminic acid biosynthesis-associated methylase
MAKPSSEVQRLESLWSGEFGDQYVARNRAAAEGRGSFWTGLLREIEVRSVLEVGCNLGGNLGWISGLVPPRGVCGVDINEQALATLRQNLPGVNSFWASARDLPFRDARFDLVFTTGVLIHQAPESLPIVMSEIVRCSRKYVLCGEYYAERLTEVPYRGHSGALWKRDFGGLYQQLFPELVLRRKGFLAKDQGGWDDVTYWMFEKAA